MRYKLLLAGLLIFPFNIIGDKSSLITEELHRDNNSFDFSRSTNHKKGALKTVDPFWELGQEKNSVDDEASLKQSNWYAEAIKGIEESEYEIKYDAAAKTYASPNRKNNLRSFYTANKFSLLPRNDSTDKWKLDLGLLGVYSGKQKIYSPVTNAAVIQKGNTIQFNNNNDFTVEYINNKEGVRQNFIIQKEPAFKPQTINIKLQTNAGWFVNKVQDREIHFAKATKTSYDTKIIYNDLRVWDADKRELSASFSIKNNNISIDVNTADAVYPVTIDPISTTPNSQLENNQAFAYMGCSVASAGDVNGDGYSDVIVGAYNFDNGQTDEGAAFVYHGGSIGINTVIQTQLECNQTSALMGYSVAGAGDVNGDGYSDVIVGAYLFSNGQGSEGSAFVFHGSSTGINSTIQAQLECNQAVAWMGRSVACAGDVNGDGYSDVIVGAHYFDNGETNEGAAFVFHGSATGIIAIIQVQLEINQPNALMGFSVASAGDVNADGYSDVIVGAEVFTNGETNEGAAFIYHGGVGGVTPTIQAQLEGNQPNAFMGYSVASAGDVNGDGYTDVIVGAFGFDNGQSDEGAAFVYHGSPTGINISIQVLLESNQFVAHMGGAVECAGDINGDGFSDVIVGVYHYSNGQSNEGAAFVYYGSNSGIINTMQTVLESDQAFSEMGISVSSAGDVNGDGYSDIIVGAWFYDNGQTDEGAAFVYHGSPDGLSASPVNTPDDADQDISYFGWSVAGAGDVNGDGFSDVVIGAYQYDGGNNNEGRAFVYHGSATGMSAVPNSILDDANQDLAYFANSVAYAGDVNGDGYSDVIIGAWQYDDVANINEGRAYVYHGSPAGLSATPNSILDDADQPGAHFGISVAGAGDVNGDGYSDVIVGAYLYDDGGNTNEGVAFVYHGGAAGLSAVPDYIADDANQAGAQFGYSVAGAGDVNGDGYSDVIIGANQFTENGNTNEGAAFVYHGSAAGLSAIPNSILNHADQAFAYFGTSVAGAGDVNGDGYSDVIAGANQYDNDFMNEGAAFVYHGSAAGLSAVPNNLFDDANQVSAAFGHSVASAGDVNGDGYSDVIIGAPAYDDGANTNEGRAFVYHGSPTGLSTSPVNTPDDADQLNALFGNSVACAGDINADGYSDVIIGAYFYDDPPYLDEGRAFVYYGNGNGGLRNNLRLYNTDLVTPIQRFNVTEPNLFGAGLFAKSALGRVKGKLVWEVKVKGAPFSGNPITNSAAYFDKQSSLTDLGISGTELKNNLQKQGMQTKVRVRVEYDKVTAITGQVYGPWRYPPGYTQGAHGMNSIPLPVTLISFNGQFVNADDIQLKWITANEINMQSFVVERSTDGLSFTAVGEMVATGFSSNRADYSFTDKNVKSNLLYYRLKLKEKTGETSYTKTITLSRSKVLKGFVAPNPVQQGADAVLTLHSAADKRSIHINIYNPPGQLVSSTGSILRNGKNELPLTTNKLSKGIYLVMVSGDGLKESYRLIVQ